MRFLSRRDYWTEPGVLTPGAIKKKPRAEGAAEPVLTVGKSFATRAIDPNYLPPFQGGLFGNVSLGLKPQAESYSPFGTKAMDETGLGFRSQICVHVGVVGLVSRYQESKIPKGSRQVVGEITIEDENDCR